MKIKVNFFDFDLVKGWLLMLTPISVIVTILSVSFSVPESFKMELFIILLILLVSSYIVYWRYSNKIDKVNMKLNNSTLTVRVGDIFLEEGLKVISFNEYFDTQADDKIISRDSINGKFLKTVEDLEYLDKYIANNENSKKNLIGQNTDRPTGKKNRYKLGTIVEYEDYLLTAFSKFEGNNAKLSMNEYINFLLSFWEEVDKIYNNRSVIIPLLGSGITRLKDRTETTDQELLELIIWSFKLSKIKFTHPHSVTILIHNSRKQNINFYKLKNEK